VYALLYTPGKMTSAHCSYVQNFWKFWYGGPTYQISWGWGTKMKIKRCLKGKQSPKFIGTNSTGWTHLQ